AKHSSEAARKSVRLMGGSIAFRAPPVHTLGGHAAWEGMGRSICRCVLGLAILSKSPPAIADAPMPPTRRPQPSAAPRSGGKRVVVRGLLAGLLRGEWEGGARLTEAEAVAKFGVSRTPVREALLELQGLGFVELRRNCGAVFLPFGPDELREIYAVRS